MFYGAFDPSASLPICLRKGKKENLKWLEFLIVYKKLEKHLLRLDSVGLSVFKETKETYVPGFKYIYFSEFNPLAFESKAALRGKRKV